MNSAHARIRRWWRTCALLILCGLLQPVAFMSASAQEEGYAESSVKAAFLYHFGTFVEWPIPTEPDQPFTIAVLGDIEVFRHLDLYLAERTIHERPVVSQFVRSPDEIERAEIVYLAPVNDRRLDSLVAAVAALHAGSLIVTDVPDGLVSGSTINFRTIDDRVRFEIDRAAAARSGLSLSSRLLAAAWRVVGGAP